MKKIFFGILLTTISIIINPIVYAKSDDEIFIFNETNDKIEKLNDTYELSKDYAIEHNKLLYEEVSYIETNIHYVNNNIVDVIERIITKEEYEESAIMLSSKCDYGTDCWETNSKMVFIYAWEVDDASCPKYMIQIDNIWKTIPNIKSFDVLAIRFPSNYKIVGGVGYQYYKVNNEQKQIEYDPNGANTKILSNGIGTSMNIVDSVTSDLHLSLKVLGTVPAGFVYFGGTYQHATSNVTLAQSQNYTISTSGLGGVLAFNSSVINKYDGMQGVSGSIYARGCYAR